ncbi:replicative DNA helicase [Oceanobacillus indicireducens]|uniref:Replicative DNA helicase n=1 Tax=Oceanobacillus indicireducens TaxID=1004261 RepID=A0A917XVD3_9BACI|nr:replicative DNA helicase [Oceanobacillus indicireducens]GGN54969.1 replicative DNA helicase [Oceanobacillus indicireducens]
MDATLEAEYGLLGCVLKQGELIKEITLQEKHFSNANNQIIFKTLREIEQANEPIDLVSVVVRLGNTNLSRIGGRKHLSDLINSVARIESYKAYEKFILESWKIREARKIQGIEIHSLDDLAAVVEKYDEIELENNDDDYDHIEAMSQLYQSIEEQEPGLSGIDTGFQDLNRMLDGFQKGDLIISAARPSVGKTAKMLNHAKAHGENGGVSAIFSLEMFKDQLNKRMLSTIGRIDGHKMRNPKQYFNADDWSRFTNAMGILSNMNMHIYDKAGQTVNEIRSKVSKLRKDYPDKDILVMIDYLQLIRSDRRYENKNIEVGEITRSLKELARDMDVPVYLLSQLSRGVENRQDKRPMMSDIRDSGSVEQDADVIEFLYRDDYYDSSSEKQNIIEVIIAKQRNGKVGTVELAFLKEYNLFADLRH